MRTADFIRCAITVTGILSLSACAVGEKKFACPGRPAGVHCMKASEIYEATQNTDVVAVTSSKALGDDPSAAKRAAAAKRSTSTSDKTKGKAPFSGAAVNGGAAFSNAPQPPYPAVESPIPIRVPAQVMRVWIAPWRDSHDRLHGGEKAFLDIASGHWAFGEAATPVEPVRFFSIQPMSGDTKGSVGKDQLAPQGRVGTSERSKTTSTLPKKETSDDSSALEHPR